MDTIKVATRGSPLAMKQAEMACEFMSKKIPGASFEIIEVKTSGDKRLDWSLEKFGGKGLFTKEIEETLLSGGADVAVHSAKDLPTSMADGLSLSGVLPRTESRDVMAIRGAVMVPTLIASGSPRRRAQLKRMFPQAVWSEIRGNVETRLKKVASGLADATVLSEAGLVRLGISEFEGIKFCPLKLDVCVPAVGQGIIALQCRNEDLSRFAPADDPKTSLMFRLERCFLTSLGGGCQAAYAANFDGESFRYFHEACGYKKILFSELRSEAEMLEKVEEIAVELK